MKKIRLLSILLGISTMLVGCGVPAANDTDTTETTPDPDASISVNGTNTTESAPGLDGPISFSWADATESTIKGNSWSPRVYTLADGKMLTAYETAKGICIMQSTDKGTTWTDSTVASFYPDLACANPNLFQLKDGSILLSYRAIGERPEGFYTSLQVSISTDGGASFTQHSTVIENYEEPGVGHGVWEPCLGYLNDVLTCFYANDSSAVNDNPILRYKMQNIEYKQWDGTQWQNQTIVSEGLSHDSRDGMPVWTPLKDGGYAMVIESSRYRNLKKYPFIIQLIYSADGVTWSEPVDIYYPTSRDSKAGAPGIIELPNGQIVVSFQTDEDVDVKGDATSVMKTIISDGTAINQLTINNFSASDQVFDVPEGSGALWTGIWYSDGILYATAGTNRGSSLKQIKLFEE